MGSETASTSEGARAKTAAPQGPPDHPAPALAALAAFDRRHGTRFATLGLIFALPTLAIYLGSVIWQTGISGGPPLPIDYVVFWSAGQLALAGEWLAPFDHAVLEAAQGPLPIPALFWLYPPAVLLAIAPLGALPYALSLAVFAALSLSAWMLALRPLFPGAPALRVGVIFAPALLPALMIGQTTALWGAGLVAAILALSHERWVLAGVLIGLLTLKPQLGIMIPAALFAIGAWRTVAAVTVTFLVVSLAPLALVGTAYWPLQLDASSAQFARLAAEALTIEAMLGFYAFVRHLGIEHGPALTAQIAMGVAAFGLVFAVWRRTALSFDAKAAVLLLAIPFATPYFWHYEFALVTLGGLFLLRAGALGSGTFAAAAMGVLWLGTLPFFLVQWIGLAPPIILAPIMMPICLAAFLYAVATGLTAQRRAIPETRP